MEPSDGSWKKNAKIRTRQNVEPHGGCSYLNCCLYFMFAVQPGETTVP